MMETAFVPSVAGLLMLLGMGGGMGLPLGVPPQPEDPILARVAPEECLFYTSWSGTAEPDAQSANQTEQLLAEPEVQHLIAELERLVHSGLRKAAGEQSHPEAAAAADDAVRWGKRLLTSPTAMFLSKLEFTPEGLDIRGGALVKLGGGALELKATLKKYQERFLAQAVETVEIGDGTWYRVQPPNPKALPITWGAKGEYFAVGVGEGAIEGMLERAGTDPPQWLVKIGEQLPVPRVSTVSYLNLAAIRDLVVPLSGRQVGARIVEAAGLGNVRSLTSVTGLDEAGFVSRALVELEGEPQGLLGLAGAEPLTPGDLAPIPRDATIALAARVDPEEVLDTILSAADGIEPGLREEILEAIGRMGEELGFNVRRDLLGPLGDTCCVYNSPGEGGLVITGLTAVIQVEDRRQLAETQAKFLARAREELGERRRGPRIDQFPFAGHDVFVFNARDDDFPLAPSWCLTDDALVIAPFPQNIKAYLSRGDDHRSIAEVPEVAGLFESGAGPVKLWYVDTKPVFELVYPLVLMVAQAALGELAEEGIDVSVAILPSAKAIGEHLRPSVGAVRRTEAGIEIVSRQSLPGGNIGTAAPLAVGLLLPAVQSARRGGGVWHPHIPPTAAARRAQSMNNMKQIALALHNYHDVYKTFPPAYTTDEDGNPLLSWRVYILPFVEQQPLYQQFHLDEPWDSEHNKKLIPSMPPTLRSPNSRAEPGKTNYLGVGGEKGIFPGKEKVGIRDITDGTSNTLMVVEANDQSAVIWTRPDDFQPDPDNPTKGLVGLRPGGFLGGLADGSVRFFSESTDGQVLQAIFTRNGSEVVNLWNSTRPR